MLFGKCKECVRMEAHIADLQNQIEMLRTLVSPPTSASRIPVLALEADQILSSADHVAVLTAEQRQELERIDSEAHRILSGTY